MHRNPEVPREAKSRDMAISREYYKDLSIEELIQDEFFIDSIRMPDKEREDFWKAFLLEYPDRRNVIETAEHFVRSLKFQPVVAPAGTKEKLWEQVIAGSRSKGTVVKMKTKRWQVWVAAAAVLFAVVLAGFLLTGESKEKINTQYAEVKQLVLPDQSVVTLNANSTITFKKEWKKNEVREVWLKGEAFFEVKHLNQEGQPVKEHERFIVHAGETSVEVLGTSFNVSDRQTVTKVMLQTGKVRIDFKDKKTASLLMEPGEVVKYDQQSKRLVKEKTTTEKYTSWKKKEFLLDNTSVEEVVTVIENTFGYKVVIEGKDMLNRQL
ncbi:MAG TPA: FecR domain-containing protein, partial [Chitinophagaceae bacterium]